MTTAERSAQLAQAIAADARTLRSAAVRLADQQSQLVAHAAGGGANPNARAALSRLAEATRTARHAIEDAQVAAQSFCLSDFSEPQVLGP
jgi:hypothetical protein